MKIFWAIILVLSPAILYGISLLFVAVYRWRCPRCGQHGLRWVSGYKWRGRDEQGRLTGGSVSFYFCICCSARLRTTKQRDWLDATDEEWKKHVKRAA